MLSQYRHSPLWCSPSSWPQSLVPQVAEVIWTARPPLGFRFPCGNLFSRPGCNPAFPRTVLLPSDLPLKLTSTVLADTCDRDLLLSLHCRTVYTCVTAVRQVDSSLSMNISAIHTFGRQERSLESQPTLTFPRPREPVHIDNHRFDRGQAGAALLFADPFKNCVPQLTH